MYSSKRIAADERSSQGGGLDIAAIVITRDRRVSLMRCLDHLRAQDPGCGATVVVDDASKDGTADAVRRAHPNVQLVRTDSPLGMAAARNLGMREARSTGSYSAFLFLDDDAYLQRDALGELMSALARDKRVGIAVPKAYQDLGVRRLHLAGELVVNFARGSIRPVGAGEIDRGQFDEPRLVQSCSGFTMLVAREVVERIGDFDETFRRPAWEDLDYSLRCVRSGHCIAYVPTAVVEHLGGTVGRGPNPEREAAKVANWFLLLRKHASRSEKAAFLVLFPFQVGAFLARRLLAGDARMVGAWLIGLWGGLTERPGRRHGA